MTLARKDRREAEAFEDLTRRILSVPQEEIKRAEEEAKKAEPKRPRGRPRKQEPPNENP